MMTLLSQRWFCSAREARVRFAPSPTGYLHLGSLRTALYNFLFARHHKGSFLLRIEDTDKARVVPGSANSIERILDYYGLHYDEGPKKPSSFGPYQQSERLPLYKDAVHQLMESGNAYRCFCSENRLALLRKDAVRRNEVPKYDMRCRSIGSSESNSRAVSGEPFVVRFKLDQQSVTFQDEVFGSVEQYIDESDMVLLKSDGFPTYHLANVVDDRAMQISHVIRGMEWLSSTGKHVILYRAFGWLPPKWLHLSLITRDGKKKLSKRDRDAFVDFYKEELGVLPNAVLNLLIRNGSGIRDFDTTHLYTLDEMIANFDESLIGKRNIQLDQEILEGYGRMAFQKTDEAELFPLIYEIIKRDLPLIEPPDPSYIKKVITFLKSNEEDFAFLSSLTKGDFRWFFTKPSNADRVLSIMDHKTAHIALSQLQGYEQLTFEDLKRLADDHGWDLPHFLALIRVTLIDNTKGPPIKELFSFFGMKECQERFANMIDFLNSRVCEFSALNKQSE